MANKPKKKVSNIMLVVICIMIICYATANFVLQYYTQIEVSPTLTTSWFAFWGVELVSLTAIKTSKIKHNQDNESVSVEDEMEEIEE
jgi:biotin transporter BioY